MASENPVDPYADLKRFYGEYQEAIKTKPYDCDKVQQQGLRFATEWNRNKVNLMVTFNMHEEKEFGYHLVRDWMKELTKE